MSKLRPKNNKKEARNGKQKRPVTFFGSFRSDLRFNSENCNYSKNIRKI